MNKQAVATYEFVNTLTGVTYTLVSWTDTHVVLSIGEGALSLVEVPVELFNSKFDVVV